MVQLQNLKLALDSAPDITQNLVNLKTSIDSREALKVLLGTSFGFGFFSLSSDPKNRFSFYHKIPKIKVKMFEFLPNIRLKYKNYVVHVHHWILASAILWFVFYITEGWNEWTIFKGLLIGAVLQGLTYSSRFKIIFRTKEAS